MTTTTAQNLLPKVGEHKKGGIVVQVHPEHLWYRVEKIVSGTKIFECFNVPDRDYAPIEAKRDTANWTIDGHRKVVRCINTGKIFARCEDAGKEYGLSKWTVQRAARTGEKVGEGYYMFEYVSSKAGEYIGH